MWAQINPLVQKLAGKLTASVVLVLAIVGILGISLLAPTGASALKGIENSPPDKDCKLIDINVKLEEFYDCKYKDKSGKEVSGTCRFYKLANLNQVECTPPYGSATGTDAGNGNGDGNGNGNDNGDEETPAPTPTCDVGALSFAICPLINFMATATDWTASILQNLLYVQPISLNTGGDNVLFGAWASILTVANILLAIAFLFVIFAQATSMALSSYGVKKMLPKIIAAAILMNLSYFICAIAVDLSNLAGVGVTGLLLQVDQDVGKGVFTGGGVSVAFGNSGIMEFVAGAGLGAILIFVFLVPALVAALAVLFTLAARLAILVLLVMVAPLAFAAWVLPNTEKYFKKWYELFITMLVLFPLVMAMFAGATVASNLIEKNSIAVRANSNAPAIEGEILTPIIILLIQSLPLFALPFLFKTAGGVLGRINDMAQQRIQKGADSKVGQAVRKRAANYGKMGGLAAVKGIGKGLDKLPGGGENSRLKRAGRAAYGAWTTARAFDAAVNQAAEARKQGREQQIHERAAEIGNMKYDKETKQGSRIGAVAGGAVRDFGGQRYSEIVAAQVDEAFGKRVKSIRSALDLEVPNMTGKNGLGERLESAIKSGRREEVSAYAQHMAAAGGATGRGELERVLTSTAIRTGDKAMANTIKNAVYRDAYKDLVGKRGSLAKGQFDETEGKWKADITKVPTASLASSDAETLQEHYVKMSQAEAQAIVTNPELWSSTSSDLSRQVLQAKAMGMPSIKVEERKRPDGTKEKFVANLTAQPTPENHAALPAIERGGNSGSVNPPGGAGGGGTPPAPQPAPNPTVVQQPAAPPPNFGGSAPAGEVRIPRDTPYGYTSESFQQQPSGLWTPTSQQPTPPQNPPQSPQNPPDQGNNPPAAGGPPLTERPTQRNLYPPDEGPTQPR